MLGRPAWHRECGVGLLDRGIIAYRQMIFDNIDRMQRGQDPQGIIRNPEDAEYTYGTEGDLGGGWRGFHAPNPGVGNNQNPQIAMAPTG